jgi:hypothetical protein
VNHGLLARKKEIEKEKEEKQINKEEKLKKKNRISIHD